MKNKGLLFGLIAGAVGVLSAGVALIVLKKRRVKKAVIAELAYEEDDDEGSLNMEEYAAEYYRDDEDLIPVTEASDLGSDIDAINEVIPADKPTKNNRKKVN